MGEDDVRRLADLKLKVEEKIKSLEEELELMREISRLIDDQLKRGSFARASQVAPPEGATEEAREEVAVRVLRRGRDNLPLATAKIYRDSVVVEVNPELQLASSVPPFRSYFINRVLNEIRAADEREGKGKALDYEIEEDGRLSRLVIRNPGGEDRVNEVLNILTWTFTKMLEKVEKPAGGEE